MVRSERGEARVLGTSFIVAKTAGDDSDFRMLSRLVEVEDAGHRGKIRLKDGQRTRLTLEAPPLSARDYDPRSDSDDWERELKKPSREIERGILKLGDKLRHL